MHTAILAGLILWAIREVWVVVYRLFFHPLARIPGPKIAAATQLFEFCYDVLKWPGGQYSFEIDKMHERYGPIVRVTPYEIHVKDPDWFDELYCSASAGTRDKYPPSAHMTGTPLGTFGTVNHRLHHQRRAAIGTFFSKRAMTDVEPLIHANVKTLCDTIRRQQERDGHVELRVNFLAMTTDTIANHSLNGSNPQNTISLLENEERAAEWKRTIAALAMLTPIVKQATWLIPVALKVPVAIWMMTIPSLGRIVRLNRDMHRSAQSYIDQTIHDSKKTESTIESIAEYHNIFRTILQSSLPPQEKTPERLGQEGFVSIAAGGETCGRMLTNAIYYIIANKDRVMPSLAHELAAVMPNPDVQPELQALEQLPYLTGVIRETLRLSAILTSRLPLVAPDRTLRYKDSVIPPGHPVSMSLRDILHDPSIFRDPLAFRPERWLRSNPDYELVNRFYVPFSRGTRMCIGINIAYAQLYIVLACVLRRFEVSDFDVVYERDIKAARDCFIGEPSLESLGVRVKMEPVLAGQTRLAG